jgi:hypothetical protein
VLILDEFFDVGSDLDKGQVRLKYFLDFLFVTNPSVFISAAILARLFSKLAFPARLAIPAGEVLTDSGGVCSWTTNSSTMNFGFGGWLDLKDGIFFTISR